MPVIDFVDEVIVVGGCYPWIASNYECIGFNPVCSSNAVYEA